MAKTPNPRAKEIREKNEVFHVRALQSHPYCDEIVKRIVAGKSAQSIARWCQRSASKAAGVKNFTFFTWRLYISTLRQRIRPLLKGVKFQRPTPELCAALAKQIRRDNEIAIEDENSDSQPHKRRLSTAVKIAIGEVEAETALKYAFLSQCERLENLIKKENKTGVLDKNGYKQVLVILEIGVALAKLELGQHFMRAGKVYADSGTPPAQHVATKQPTASEPTGSESPLFFWEGGPVDNSTPANPLRPRHFSSRI